VNDIDRARHELFGAWCAPIFTVLTVVGFLVLAGFAAPASAAWTPAQVAGYYTEHQNGVLLGMSLFCVATAFLCVYSVQFGIALWRIEGAPLMSGVQALGGLGVVLLIFVSNCLWIGAAYRADVASPDVTVALNDAAWFNFLVGWVILSLQMFAAAAVTIKDRSPRPLFPRWLSVASLVGAVLLVTANGCVFAKSGVFAWTGALGYYLPMGIWGVWLDGHAWFVRQGARARLRDAEQAAAGLTAGAPGTPASASPRG
jgi:hypothetical protein